MIQNLSACNPRFECVDFSSVSEISDLLLEHLNVSQVYRQSHVGIEHPHSTYEWRTKLPTTRNGHGQTGWSPIGCEGLYV